MENMICHFLEIYRPKNKLSKDICPVEATDEICWSAQAENANQGNIDYFDNIFEQCETMYIVCCFYWE